MLFRSIAHERGEVPFQERAVCGDSLHTAVFPLYSSEQGYGQAAGGVSAQRDVGVSVAAHLCQCGVDVVEILSLFPYVEAC